LEKSLSTCRLAIVPTELTAAAETRSTSNGDRDSRREVIESYLPLVRRIARRFEHRGEQLEDLVQVGAIAMIGAVDRCDPDRAGLLTAYVSRCVDGEIRRHLRDRSSVLRVPRHLGAARLPAVVTARAPLQLDAELELFSTEREPDEVGLARALVSSAARSLDRRERRVLVLRYCLGLSQAEIGDRVGISQVHVSRLLRDAIAKMRVRVAPDEP
jgi:RNA polymerase sigma-B factor